MFYAGFDLLFSILFPILFLVVLGMILYTIIGNISTWNKNNHSPRLTVPATVVAKRTEVSRHHTDNTMAHTFTTYYVTFQVESGDRMELTVRGKPTFIIEYIITLLAGDPQNGCPLFLYSKI